VRRLADESVEIAAPILLRSKVLTDIDLIGLIGRNGLPHARVIAKRQDLHPTIAQLAAALARSERCRELSDLVATPASIEDRPMQSFQRTVDPDPAAGRHQPGDAAEDVRSRLRAMMQPRVGEKAARPGRVDLGSREDMHSKLRDSALTGVSAFFQTALADALGIGFVQMRAIVATTDLTDLIAALKFLELSEELAFVIAAALQPGRFAHAEAIRLFLDRYRLLHREAAADRVRGWKEAALAAALPSFTAWRAEAGHEPANSPGRPQVFGTRQLRSA